MVIAPNNDQLSPLEIIVDVEFPMYISDIEGAIHYVLDGSGFELISKELRPKEMNIMLANRLPLVHRDLTPMMLKDALNVLVGKHFRLINDPLRRRVSFILLDKYKGLIDE
jgi:type IV pili sensor histidine kinase/response regulator